MAWDIGGVTLALDEEPDDGEVNVSTSGEWIRRPTIGGTKRVKQRLSTYPTPSRVHAFWSETTKDSIKALVDAGDPVVLTIDEIPYYAGGVTVSLIEFQAALTSRVRGLPWYDCTLEWEE